MTGFRFILSVALLLLHTLVYADPNAEMSDEEPLPVEQAFQGSVKQLNPQTLRFTWVIAEGYYLYRDKFSFKSLSAPVQLGEAQYPPGKLKHDEFFGNVETFRGEVVVKLALAGSGPGQSVVIAADSQGCADQGVCYPPTMQKVTIVLPAAGKGPGPQVDAYPPKKRWFN